MDEHEVDSKITGLHNYVVPVRGSTVTAYLGRWDRTPHLWIYTLWTGRNGTEGDTELLATGDLDLSAGGTDHPMDISADQVARIAFLLEVEYGS